MAKTLREIVEESVGGDITDEFTETFVNTNMVVDDDIFANLPDEIPEPTDEDRVHVTKYFGRIGPSYFVGF